MIVKEPKQSDHPEEDGDQPEEEIVDKLVLKDPTPLILYPQILRKSKLEK